MISVGTLLKEYLDNNKISQTEFAEMYNISKKHINEILSGKTGISLDTLMLLSLITNNDINVLLYFNEHKKADDFLRSNFKNDKEIKEYLTSLNIYEMEKNNWIKLRHKEDYATTLIDFKKKFHIDDINNFFSYTKKNYLYKEAGEKDLVKVALWIAHCNNLIEGLEVPKYDSKNFRSYYYIGIVYCVLEDFEKAVENFTKSLSINEFQSHARYRRAIAYSKIGEDSKALEDVYSAEALGLKDNDLQFLKQKLLKKLDMTM